MIAPGSLPSPVPAASQAGALPHPAAGPAPGPSSGPPASPATAARKDRVAAQLTLILSDLSGMEVASLDPTASFVELGFDSLFLTQASAHFRKLFGVRITFRQLFEEAPSIDSLAAYIDSKLPPAAFPEPEAAPPGTDPAGGASREGIAAPLPASAPTGTRPGSGSSVEWVIREQLRIMEQQLELVRTGALPAPHGPGTRPSLAPTAGAGAPAVSPTTHYLATGDQTHRPGGTSRAITDRQQAAIDELIRRYNARTPGSKRLAQLWRPRLADNRAIVGFDKMWKELVYQIVSERSAGSRIWDVDGNEFIDTALGFGTNLFGHSPDFVVDAVRDQLGRGFAVGVQSDLLGDVAEMACVMTANDRLAFTTSGGEAVETAIRVARTVTDRAKVAYFTDDIHGRSDIVLGRAVDARGEARTVPMVAGVPQRVVDDALVLEYGTDRAMEAIRANASELALVLVEPVRSRNPDLQPVAFLRELRRLADVHGFLLVFDEIVTGFRAHQGGVRALFDVRPDITTYGKVLGGGLPIGVVAGSRQFIDVIDGGPWQYGDDSFPEADITASGGTMIKHALTLAASRAVLHHLRDWGPRCRRTSTGGRRRPSRRSTRGTGRRDCPSMSSSSAPSSGRPSTTPLGSRGCSSTTCAIEACTRTRRPRRSSRRPIPRPTSRPSSRPTSAPGETWRPAACSTRPWWAAPPGRSRSVRRTSVRSRCSRTSLGSSASAAPPIPITGTWVSCFSGTSRSSRTRWNGSSRS